jgi:DNA invertase Pin-like site-specific DNA recombinase
MAKYATYFRVSTENQGKSGLGLQAQQEAVQRFLKEGNSNAAQFTEVESEPGATCSGATAASERTPCSSHQPKKIRNGAPVDQHG